jgi:hypothetical protein
MSEHPCEERYQKLIDRAFVGDLSPDRWRDLSTHLETCDACRAYHDKLGLIDEAMGRSPLTSSMRDRIAEQVIAAASGGTPRTARPSVLSWLSYASAVAAVVVLAVMLPFVAKDDEFRARGTKSEWSGRSPGIGLFCITPPSEGQNALVDRTVQASSSAAPVLSCRLDQEIQIAYATPSKKKLYLTVQGESGNDTFWYAPLTPGRPIELEPDADGRALGWSTRLGVNHEVGTVRVKARFYDDPSADEPIYELSAELEVRPAK